MNERIKNYWRDVLLKLQKAEEEVAKTQGYTKEAESLRMLRELIKEQVPNESADTSTRSIR